MTDTLPYRPQPESPMPPSPADRALAIIAWCVVGLIAILLPVLNAMSHRFEPGGAGVDVAFQAQGRYILGAARCFESQTQTLVDQLFSMATTDQQKRAAEIVLQIASDPKAVVTTDTSEFNPYLPWFAQLAEVKTRDAAIATADALFVRYIALLGVGIVALVTGVGLGITAIVLLALGKLSLIWVRPTAPAGVYIEAFAMWIGLYLSGSLVLEVVMRGNGSMLVRMLPLVAAFAVSFAWPVIRGVRWDVARHDIGLHTGRGVFREIGAGLLGYLACLPVLGASMLFVLIVQRFVKQEASHPIQQMLLDTNPIWIYLLAAVFAPITEEILFRGVLQTHLRGRLGIWLSGIISGLIFAAIHPQGWIAIPTLMTIAMILSLIREWRHSLIAPMVAHAVNNAAVVTVLVLVMR